MKIEISDTMRDAIVSALPKPRPLYAIAIDIRAHWPKPYFGAVPYIDAMRAVASINDPYGVESARGLVLYFLANAGTWRGEHAKRIKAELRGML